MEAAQQKSPETVAELLGLPVEEGLYAAVYSVGSEPATSRPARSRAPRARRVVHATLDPFLAEARAGASDRAIATASGASVAQVGKWRRERDVARPRGRPTGPARATSLAVELMGHPFDPVLAEVRTSIVGGHFAPPQYVLRDGLDYEIFVKCVEALVLNGFREDQIALGLGVRHDDVLLALAMSTRAA